MLDGSHFFECSCCADEHTIRFVYDEPNNELYLMVFLNQWRPWYKRLWVAIKYFCGYKCRYGHWDTWTMCDDDCTRLGMLLAKVAKPANKEDVN